MNHGKGRSGLKKAIADHARQIGQTMTDDDLESASDALVSFFALLADTNKKLMIEKNERDNRNPNHPD